MTCEEFEDISGAYVLDAVTPAERLAARAHLAQCALCTRRLQELRAIVALLPLSVTQINPPATLKERIMAHIRQEGTPAPPSLTPMQPIPITQRPRRRRPGLVTQILAAAAMIMFLLFGGTAVWNASLQAHATALGQQVTTLQGQNTALKKQLAGVLPNPKTYAVASTPSGPQGASGQLIYLPQQNLIVLSMHGLPQLQGTHVYQGWLIQDGLPRSIGLLTVQNGIASISYPGNLSGSVAAAVSLEPGPSASASPHTVIAEGLL